MSDTMLYKLRSIQQRTHLKQQKSYIETYFGFFLRDEEFVSKTINDSNIDLEKFPASKVRQLAKKLESSKSTARHVKKVSSEPKVTLVNLLKHQRTEIPPNKSKQKQFKNNKPRPQSMGYSSETNQQQAQYKKFNPRKRTRPHSCVLDQTPVPMLTLCPVVYINYCSRNQIVQILH